MIDRPYATETQKQQDKGTEDSIVPHLPLGNVTRKNCDDKTVHFMCLHLLIQCSRQARTAQKLLSHQNVLGQTGEGILVTCCKTGGLGFGCLCISGVDVYSNGLQWHIWLCNQESQGKTGNDIYEQKRENLRQRSRKESESDDMYFKFWFCNAVHLVLGKANPWALLQKQL